MHSEGPQLHSAIHTYSANFLLTGHIWVHSGHQVYSGTIFFIQTATEYYGEDMYCLLSEVRFDGWSFKYECIVCQEGWFVGEKG